MADETWAFAQAKLADYWSPEQISGHLKANNLPSVSHETLYQRIYADKRAARCTVICAARSFARSATGGENDAVRYGCD
jgi:IS30 family transposase